METIVIVYNERQLGQQQQKYSIKVTENLNQLRDFLQKIPGPPTDIRIIGRGPDRVKLS